MGTSADDPARGDRQLTNTIPGTHFKRAASSSKAAAEQAVMGAAPRRSSRSIRIGNNLNQLVHLANSGVVLAPKLVEVVVEVRTELRALRTALLKAEARRDSEAAG